MTKKNACVKGSAEMWTLSGDKKTVQLQVSPTNGEGTVLPLQIEFDRSALEATLSALVQMHFEMMRNKPAEIPQPISPTRH